MMKTNDYHYLSVVTCSHIIVYGLLILDIILESIYLSMNYWY